MKRISFVGCKAKMWKLKKDGGGKPHKNNGVVFRGGPYKGRL